MVKNRHPNNFLFLIVSQLLFKMSIFIELDLLQCQRDTQTFNTHLTHIEADAAE